jgi:hypothetical protein
MVVMQKTSIASFSKILMTLTLLIVGGCTSRTDLGEPRANIEAAENVFEIGVNAYLWRATLDTIGFLPLLTADQAGGVILSDWKVNPSDENERTKVDVYIVGKDLRADALNVTVHREELKDGTWKSIEPRPNAETQVITAIILQAKLLRRDNAPETVTD